MIRIGASTARPPLPRSAVRGVVLGVCVALVAGTWALREPRSDAHRSTAAAVRPVAPAERPAVGPIIGAGPYAPAVRIQVPVRLRIPAIGVDTRLERLGLAPDGTLEAPSAWGIAGWYAGGPRPGEAGPAVIAGHVDSTGGPAVFYRLRELRPGDRVVVTQRSGRLLRFVVEDVASFPKERFPTATVYGPHPLPVLRLITCTGAFDAARHGYLDNLVVSAYLS